MKTHEAQPDTPTHEPDRCRAHTSAGRPCRNHPIRGATVCRVHGGSAPQVRAAAQRRETQRGALQAAQRLAEEAGSDLHPLEHLAGALATSANVVRVYADEVAQLGDLTQWSSVGGREPHVLIRMWSEERDRHAKLAKTALDAGIDVRRLQLDEENGRLIADAITATAREYGLDMQAEEVRRTLGRNLRAASEGELSATHNERRLT